MQPVNVCTLAMFPILIGVFMMGTKIGLVLACIGIGMVFASLITDERGGV